MHISDLWDVDRKPSTRIRTALLPWQFALVLAWSIGISIKTVADEVPKPTPHAKHEVEFHGLEGLERLNRLIIYWANRLDDSRTAHTDDGKNSAEYTLICFYRHRMTVLMKEERKNGVIPRETLEKYENIVRQNEKLYPNLSGDYIDH